MSAALWPALALAACGPPDAVPEASPAPEDTGAMVWSAAAPEPEIGVEEVAEILASVVDLGVPSPDDIAETYGWLMTLGGERCPGLDTDLYEPEGGCLTEDGTLYAGIGWYDVAETLEDPTGERVELSYTHGGDYVISTAAGERFAGGGEIEVWSAWEDDTLVSWLEMEGTWEHNVREDWLGQRLSVAYGAVVELRPDSAAVTLQGGLALGETWMAFEHLGWDTGGDCAGAATGALLVRDSRGYWTAWDLGDDCDTCGAVSFHDGQELGELCLDLGDWGEAWRAQSAPH